MSEKFAGTKYQTILKSLSGELLRKQEY